MRVFNCIFVDQPKECAVCSETGKLQCLLNKRHLKVRPKSMVELIEILLNDIDSPERYKIKAGEVGRK